MDWDNQPDPFRRFSGAPLYHLPLERWDGAPPYEALYAPGAVASAPLTVEALSRLFAWSLGLSAWKEYGGTRWELRCNPSSGNLHPTEGYLVAPPIDAFNTHPAIYHYAPKEHALELRAQLEDAHWHNLAAPFPKPVFFVGLSSIYWREAWKYGERAYRYCNHDTGHALAALSFAGAALGWRVVWLDALADTEVAHLLGLDRDADFARAEREHPDLVAAVVPADHGRAVPNGFLPGALERVSRGSWSGLANRLSAEQTDWPLIEAAQHACSKPATAGRAYAAIVHASPVHAGDTSQFPGPGSAEIFLQRRSAVAMDGTTGMSAANLFAMLERVLPHPACPPWSAVPGPAMIHLLLFVHRVEGIAPGMYMFLRDAHVLAALRTACTRSLAWKPVSNPLGLALYLLTEGDCQGLAGQLSCQQTIAADGAFSLGMLANFEEPIRRDGPWRYPWLFREAGMVGQVLYLEAEARGLRATGIGCYFDDPVHDELGLRDHRFQSLYHFTVGGAVDDPRLRPLPPYTEERRQLPAGLSRNTQEQP
jgi:SagB-type dehydrogenase family enzyme